MAKPLPPQPNLQFLKKHAKQLHRDYQRGTPEAIERFAAHPQFASNASQTWSLHDAQLVVAREYGFDSWAKLKEYVGQLVEDSSDETTQVHDHVQQIDSFYRRFVTPLNEPTSLKLALAHEADALVDAHGRQDLSAAMVLRLGYSPESRPNDEAIFGMPLSIEAAREAIAKSYLFSSWSQVEECQPRVIQPKFEQAVDAIVSGRSDVLRELLRDASLVRQRSAFAHRATLLHYVAANGVETRRQRTPNNIGDITRLLLAHGAEVDALSESYGGGASQTTLCLTVSSGHPADRGVQTDIVGALLDAGAQVNGIQNDGLPLATALAFGYRETAEFLAHHGARVDNVVLAAGLGRVGLLGSLIGADGTLAGGQRYVDPFGPIVESDYELKNRALLVACNNGDEKAVELLVQRGADVDCSVRDRQTGLHWAAYYGHLPVVRSLVERGGNPNARDDQWKSKPIVWAAEGKQHEVVAFLATRTELELAEAVDIGLVAGYSAAAPRSGSKW